MNRSMKNLFLAGAVALAGLSGYALADAPKGGDAGVGATEGQWHHGRGGKGMRSMAGMLTRHAPELGLSPQQVTAIKAAEDAARPELERLHTTLHQQREAAEEKGDATQLKATRAALHAGHQALRTQIQGILTAEQRAKLAEKMEQRRRKHCDEQGVPAGQPPLR